MTRAHSLRQTLLALFSGAALVAALPAPGAGQGVAAARGLGLEMAPVDARARALGGLGLGLPEVNFSLVNPASVHGFAVPAFTATFQPEYRRTDGVEGDEWASLMRFPLIHAVFPVRERWTASLGYGALLEQGWAVESEDTLRIGGSDVPFRERFESRGGVGFLRGGVAYAPIDRLRLGAALDLHTGSVRRSFDRQFDPARQIQPTITQVEWGYSGLSYTLGAEWDPAEAVRLSTALTLGGTLEAESRDALAEPVSYPLPHRFAAGASARVTPGTIVAVGGDWRGWGRADEALAAVGGARDSWSVSGGLEWESPGAEARSYPLRLGGRYAAIPFPGADGEWLDERAVTGGIGARLAGGVARADLAVERGWGGVEDSAFWRISLSLTALGR